MSNAFSIVESGAMIVVLLQLELMECREYKCAKNLGTGVARDGEKRCTEVIGTAGTDAIFRCCT